MIDRSSLTTTVSAMNTQSSRDRPVTPLLNVICRKRVGLFPPARHTSIDPRRTSRGEPLDRWTRGFRVLLLSRSDTITVAVGVSDCARSSVN
jgi:hypothetical protein